MQLKSKDVFGIILIAAGVLLLVGQYTGFRLFGDDFWPVFVLGPGLVFEYIYFTSQRNPAFLVPGGILSVCGLLFFFENATGWRFSEYTWPTYPLAVAFGLYQLYGATGRHRALLMAVLMLSAVSIISFFSIFWNLLFRSFDFSIVVGAMLLLVGIGLITRKK
jgi:hypothetical protein